MASAKRRRFVAVASALACAICATACGSKADRPLQGYVEGEYVRVAAPFAGTLQQLTVQRGGGVAAGAPLFALERENESAARRQAERQLQPARPRRANLKTAKPPPAHASAPQPPRQA